MKKYLLILWAVLGGFGLEGFGQSEELDWKWQNPLPTGNYLNDVQFLDTQTGWAVGSNGTIIKTSDGGVSWQSQTNEPIDWLSSIHFIDSQNGWVAGIKGVIMKTSNGGQSWEHQTTGVVHALSCIYFVNSQTGWAVGNAGTILKTINGGQTWQNQTITTNLSYSHVHFFDDQIGWIIGHNGTIIKTINGGQTWQIQNSLTTNYLFSAHFIDSQIGWIAGENGTILKTTNGGQSWQSQNSGITTKFFTVFFINPQQGWVVGENGSILKTSNGGQSWQIQNSGTLNSLSLYSIHFIDSETGWVVGPNGAILKTSNGGSNWQSQKNGIISNFLSVQFVNAQTGWTVGSGGTILKTYDGGQIWQSQNSGTTNWLMSVHFTDSETGWAVGSSGLIIKTSNGGSNWLNQSSGTTQTLYSIFFTDSQTGWAVGSSGLIIKTSNGGQTWQSQSSGFLGMIRSVYFTDSQTGWAVGDEGRILTTTNGGQSWQNQYSGTTNWLNSVHFTNSDNGWAVGSSGTILRTINGGESWQIQNSGETLFHLNTVHFTDALNGWVFGNGGTILKTSNGGQIWQKLNSGTINGLASGHFTDLSHGWAVGEVGTILTTVINGPISPTTLITGNLFEKTTTNCNTSPIQVPNQLVKALPGPYYAISNNQGKYNMRLPLAHTPISYTLQAIENQNQAFNIEVVCPTNNQFNVLLDTIPDTLSGKDFGFDITQCHHLDVQIASDRRRRCFKNTTGISYFNQGSVAAPDAFILVEFPHWVRPISASRSYVVVNDSVWRFNLDTVLAGHGGYFTITDSVLCGNLSILSLTQCTKATIYPAPDCPVSPNYSGAEVSVSGKCNNGIVNLGIYNRTAVAMPDSVDYWVYIDSIQVRQAKVKLAAGDSLKMNVDAMGFAVHLTVNQVANHPSDLFLSTTVEACSDTTIFYPKPAVNKFPIGQRPNSKTHCLEIRGSYDPNDKQAFPTGFTANHIVKPGTEMDYLIRFQNSGNDTAFTVYVVDTLDQNLNVESFQMGAASHSYELTMQTVKSGKTFLKWQFNNILLPDSATNEPKSNGFIQFRISPKAGLALGSQVRNHADIYFDFNPPIVTNQTLTTFNNIVFTNPALNNNVQIVTHVGPKTISQIGVKLYPNPVTQNKLTVDFGIPGSLVLFNAKGQIVYQAENLEGIQDLPVRLKTGLYFAKIETEKGRTTEKVVVIE